MKKQILFIDDESDVLKGIRRMLRDCDQDWQMTFISNPDALFELVSQNAFDVIVCDYKMPGLDGFELLSQIRQPENINRDAEFVILTGVTGHDMKRRALDLGATDLLNKPVDTADLVSRIKSLIRVKNNRDALKKKNALLEKQLEIVQKTELMGIMAAGAIHDLKNLIGGVTGISEMAMDDNSSLPEVQHDFKLIHMSASRALDILMRIHHFSLPDSENEVVRIHDILVDCVSLLKVMSNKMIKIEYKQWHDDKSDFLFGSSAEVFQVFMNICINSIQAVDEKGVVSICHENCRLDACLLTATGELKPGKYSLVKIKDNGPGIPEAQIQSIFTPAFTTKHRSGGTGLGLAVVRSIVERMDGGVDVLSRLNEGAEFDVYLPLMR